MNICEHLTVTAKLFPDKVALIFEEHRFTFTELDRLAQAAGQLLDDAGVARGSRVAIVLPNVPAFVVWYYAALRIGAIAVSISTRLTTSEIVDLLSDCQATSLVALSGTLEGIQNELPTCVTSCIATSENGDIGNNKPLTIDANDFTDSRQATTNWVQTEPDEPALILYTSGTTGFAKGATLSHRNVRSNVHAFNHLCNMRPGERILLAVPLFHCFGQNALLNSAFNVGATIVLQRSFNLNESRKLITEGKVTQLYGVPMMFRLFLDSFQPADLGSVDYCFSAAATLPIQTSRRWQEKFGLPLNEGYGLTETSPFASYNHHLKFVPGSIGTPIDSVEMKIVDTETAADCPPGDLGEIAIRGPNVMLGYWNRPDETAQAIRNGWFYSGDIGRQDENGFFYIVDRVKDMISVGGLKVYPAEVERVLLDHPAISQTAVVGFSDEVSGEQVVAFVVLADPALEAADQIAVIREHARDNLAPYKVPRIVQTISELPRNPSGKVLKTELRKMELPAMLPHTIPASDQPSAQSINSSSPKINATSNLRGQLAASHAASRINIVNQFVANSGAIDHGFPAST